MSLRDWKVSNYQEALDYMQNKGERPFVGGRDTRVFMYDDFDEDGNRFSAVGVQYHWTEVVTYTPMGMVLNAGRYQTVTTKARLNLALNAIHGAAGGVYQSAYEWYYTWGPGHRVEFENEMMVSYETLEPINVYYKYPSPEKFFQEIRNSIIANSPKVHPDDSDCPACRGTRRWLGVRCLVSHVTQNRVQGSLIYNALDQYDLKSRQRMVRLSMMNPIIDSPYDLDFELSDLADDVIKAVEKYLKHRRAIK